MRVALSCLLAAGCVFPRPSSTADHDMVADVAHRWDRVFPDGVGLMRPRFGIPAVLEGGTSFELVTLDTAGPSPRAALLRFDASAAEVTRCLARGEGEDCIPLVLEERIGERIGERFALRTYAATPMRAPSARGWDLVVAQGDRIARAHKAVWARAPGGEALRVAQLSDLHVGRSGQNEVVAARLAEVIAEVNASAPDVVVVTGDMAEEGRSLALEEWAHGALLQLDAPVLAILGNHDYGHFPKVLRPAEPDRGYFAFARAFHPYRFFATSIGGWDFVGFDSGPSLFSTRILTRGIDEATLARIGGVLDHAAAADRGVVLFSHAPTRAAVTARGEGTHAIGSMRAGGEALEQLLLAADHRGQRVLHLSGHTHFSDLFLGEAGRFRRVPFAQLSAPVELGRAALVNAPSATRVSFHVLEHGTSFGWVELRLSRRSEVVFRLHHG